MTFEALLTFFAVLVGALTIARPVQRRSLALFFPTWCLLFAVLISVGLLILRDAPYGVPPPRGWELEKVLFWLTMGAFFVPVSAALWAWGAWHRARLSRRGMAKVEQVFAAALREHEFDEVERILQKNPDRLHLLPPSAATVLFTPAMVSALLQSHSLVHLELLANLEFLKSLSNRHQAVEATVHELLQAEISPLRSAVFEKFGGLEHFTYSNRDQKLMERTFQNPEWYYEANAHYPLTIAAINRLQSGALDHEYNEAGDLYETSQGVSSRSRCPVFIAEKTEVLALEAVVEQRIERDFYVSDMFQIFRQVQERSKVSPVWDQPLAERPTPFAYLLYEIGEDLSDLSGLAFEKAFNSRAGEVATPGQVAEALAQIWSFCVWSIADSQEQVTQEFRTRFIERYLVFVLRLGWQPNEVAYGVTTAINGLNAWRDIFLNELKDRFVGDHDRREELKSAFASLDWGKSYVQQGSDWLKAELSL